MPPIIVLELPETKEKRHSPPPPCGEGSFFLLCTLGPSTSWPLAHCTLMLSSRHGPAPNRDIILRPPPLFHEAPSPNPKRHPNHIYPNPSIKIALSCQSRDYLIFRIVTEGGRGERKHSRMNCPMGVLECIFSQSLISLPGKPPFISQRFED